MTESSASKSLYMEKWNVNELCEWLSELKLELSKDISQDFRREEVDGRALVAAETMDDMSSLLPETKRGPLMKIFKEKNAYIKTMQPPKPADFQKMLKSEVRPFGSIPKGTTYLEGSVLCEDGKLLVECGPDYEHILIPVREGKSVSNGDIGAMVKRTLCFATACMNSRCNGVIYFGVEDTSWKVVGCPGLELKLKLKDKLEKAYNSNFALEGLQRIVRNCISSPRFIDIDAELDGSRFPTGKVVVEIEVQSKFEYVEEKRFFKFSKLEKSKEKLVYIRQGSSSMPISEDIETFQNITLPQWSHIRKKADEPEALAHNIKSKSLKDILQRERILDNSTVQVLIVDEPSPTDIEDNYLVFISYLKWRVVIDLDSSCSLHKIYTDKDHRTNILSPENFVNDRLKLHSIKDQNTTCWIYANGNHSSREDAYDYQTWKERRKNGITNAISEIRDISMGRAFFVCLFFSDKLGIASDLYEYCVGNSEKMLFIAEQDMAIDLLRCKVSESKRKLDAHGIVGLPWRHVQATFEQLCEIQKFDCEVPTSSTAAIPIKRSQFPDLEILGSNECSHLSLKNVGDRQHLDQRYKFYGGNLVSWLNIALSDSEKIDRKHRHVVKRDKHDDLRQKVQNCLSRNNEVRSAERYKVVTLYHQPGSGASTVSRHVLWSFRKDYKCAVINAINATSTRDQIVSFYLHGEDGVQHDRLKPVLLLLDIADQNLCRLFLDDLPYAKLPTTHTQPLCVVINCQKTIKAPQYEASRGIFLEQQLTIDEYDKFAEIVSHIKNSDDATGELDSPKFMLAFLLVFNSSGAEFIRNQVLCYLASNDLQNWEMKIMKYIALMNAYYEKDPEIPISVFDSMVPSYYLTGNEEVAWWWHLSDTFKLFVLETSKDSLGSVGAFQIRYRGLAKTILEELMDMSENKTLSSTAIEFLESDVFKSKWTNSRTDAMQMAKWMLLERNQEKTKYGERSSAFSAIINAILNGETFSEEAFKVLDTAFRTLITTDDQKDAFIAQVIARLCMKDPTKVDIALKYAQEAISLTPHNSWLLHTIGEVYKSKLFQNFNCYTKANNRDAKPLPIEKFPEAVTLAKFATEHFKLSVQCNAKEGNVNYYGLIGELEIYRTIIELLQSIPKFSTPKGLQHVHQYLTEPQYFYRDTEKDWKDHHEFLKNLLYNTETAINHSLDFLNMMNTADSRDYGGENNRRQTFDQDKSQRPMDEVVKCKTAFESFLGTKRHPDSKHLKSKTAMCAWNRSVVKQHGGLHFSSIFKLDLETLKRISMLLQENVQQPSLPFNDFDNKSLLIVSMAIGISGCEEVTPAYIYRQCRTYRTVSSDVKILPNLFLSMLLWPGNNFEGVDYDNDFYKQVLKELADDGNKMTKRDKTPRSRVEEYQSAKRLGTARLPAPKFKSATHFFLGKEPGLRSIVHINTIPDSWDRGTFWETDKATDVLKKVYGTRKDRSSIKAFNEKLDNNAGLIDIKIAYPTPVNSEEIVEFYLGFSWAGLVAYNVQPRQI